MVAASQKEEGELTDARFPLDSSLYQVYLSLRYFELAMNYKVGITPMIPLPCPTSTGIPLGVDDEEFPSSPLEALAVPTFAPPSARLWAPWIAQLFASKFKLCSLFRRWLRRR